MPFQVDENDLSFINQVERSWEEFKRPEWRTYTPRSSKQTDQKRLWAIAIGSRWKGTSKAKMEHLLQLFPLAVEHAASLTAFASARTTVWTILQSAEGLERLAGGIAPLRQLEVKQYQHQIIRLRLPEDSIAAVRALAAGQGVTCSQFVAGVIEEWLAHRFTFEAEQ